MIFVLFAAEKKEQLTAYNNENMHMMWITLTNDNLCDIKKF